MVDNNDQQQTRTSLFKLKVVLTAVKTLLPWILCPAAAPSRSGCHRSETAVKRVAFSPTSSKATRWTDEVKNNASSENPFVFFLLSYNPMAAGSALSSVHVPLYEIQ